MRAWSTAQIPALSISHPGSEAWPDQKVQTGIKIPDKYSQYLGRGPLTPLRLTPGTRGLYLTRVQAGLFSISAQFSGQPVSLMVWNINTVHTRGKYLTLLWGGKL